MAKSLTRCSSLHCAVGPATASAHAHFLHHPEHGVWAIAHDLEAGEYGTPGPGQLLLDVLREQVASGEDLTAALLVAHGRVQREFAEGQGSRVIALRLNRATNSFELAWVGAMQAHLVRGGEILQITNTSDRGEVGDTQTNAYQMRAKRVAGLGGAERIRPVIDRKLGHAQAGDYLVLSARALEGEALSAALRSKLKGIWSLDYKLRMLKSALADSLESDALMPILLWRAR